MTELVVAAGSWPTVCWGYVQLWGSTGTWVSIEMDI